MSFFTTKINALAGQIFFIGKPFPLHLRSQEIKLVLHNKMMTIKREFTMQGLSKTIDVRDLPADVYILQITIGNEKTFEKNIIVTD